MDMQTVGEYTVDWQLFSACRCWILLDQEHIVCVCVCVCACVGGGGGGECELYWSFSHVSMQIQYKHVYDIIRCSTNLWSFWVKIDAGHLLGWWLKSRWFWPLQPQALIYEDTCIHYYKVGFTMNVFVWQSSCVALAAWLTLLCMAFHQVPHFSQNKSNMNVF